MIGRWFVGALCRDRAARTVRPDHVRHLPDAILIGDQQVVILPGDPVRLVEILDVAVDPFHMALAIVTQQGDVAGTLLNHQHIAVREHEQPARICQPRDVWCGDKTLGHLECLATVRNDQRPAGGDGTGLRRRQVSRIEVEPPANLVLSGEIPLEFAASLGGRVRLCRHR